MLLVAQVVTTFVLVSTSTPAGAYTTHAPILITGNADFSPANGVTGGSGTPSDPYVIEGWDIDASSASGIVIKDTTSFFVLRGNQVHSGGASFDGIRFLNVTNGAADNNTGWGNEYGFRIELSDSLGLSANNVTGNLGGIYLEQCSNVTIVSNHVSSHVWQSILISDSAAVTVDSNQISTGQVGIQIARSTNVIVRANNLTSDGVLIDDALSEVATLTISSDNLVNGKPLLFYKNCDGVIVDSIPVGELIVANCTGFRASNLEISGTDVGIQVAFGSQITLSANHLAANDYGILADSSIDLTITQNRITSNTYGLFLRDLTGTLFTGNDVSENWRGLEFDVSNSATLAENSFVRNTDTAIFLGPDVRDFRLIGNNVSSNGYGIYTVGFSENMSLLGNSVSSNLGWGLVLDVVNATVAGNHFVSNGGTAVNIGYGSNVTITGNLLANNSRGIELYGPPNPGPVGVLIYHNNFEMNGVQATDDQGPENAWNDGYPSGGNYWSDYAGVDNCSGPNQTVCPPPDGIGDAPYSIDPDSRDRYPLMQRFVPTPPIVTVVSPTGSELWTGGTSHDIRWTTIDMDTPGYLLVNMSFSSDGGMTWAPVAGPVLAPQGAGRYAWIVPAMDAGVAIVRVCVSDGISSVCELSSSFAIDSTPPSAVSASPSAGATDVPLGTPVVVTFSEAMNRSSVERAIAITPTASISSYSWDSNGAVLTIRFSNPLAENTDYTLSIGCGAQDDSSPGNVLRGCPVGTYRLEFRTQIVTPPPIARAAATPDPRVGMAMTLDGRGSTGAISSWTWTITDVTGAVVAALAGPVVTHTFTGPGTYHVTLHVTDAFGRTDEYSFDVIVVAGGGGIDAWLLAIVTASVLAAILFAAWEPGRVAILTATAGLVYGGKPKDEKDSEIRGAILYYIRVHPGDTYTDIKRNLGLNDGAVTYHLARLERDELIHSEIRGARKRYYPAGMRIPLENGGELHEVQQRILRYVAQAPGVPIAVLAEHLGVSDQLALYHLRKLAQAQRVELTRTRLQLRAYPRVSNSAETDH